MKLWSNKLNTKFNDASVQGVQMAKSRKRAMKDLLVTNDQIFGVDL